MFEKVKLNEKGFMVQGINTFIVVAVMLAVTVYLVYQITASMPLITAGAYNTTQATVNSGIGNALNIAPILLILIIVALVIGAVMSFTSVGRGQ